MEENQAGHIQRNERSREAMKRLYNALKIALWCVIGVFIGSSLYQYIDYKARPGLYQWQSAPWYVSIEVRGLFTAVIVAVLGIALWAIRNRAT